MIVEDRCGFLDFSSHQHKIAYPTIREKSLVKHNIQVYFHHIFLAGVDKHAFELLEELLGTGDNALHRTIIVKMQAVNHRWKRLFNLIYHHTMLFQKVRLIHQQMQEKETKNKTAVEDMQ